MDRQFSSQQGSILNFKSATRIYYYNIILFESTRLWRQKPFLKWTVFGTNNCNLPPVSSCRAVLCVYLMFLTVSSSYQNVDECVFKPQVGHLNVHLSQDNRRLSQSKTLQSWPFLLCGIKLSGAPIVEKMLFIKLLVEFGCIMTWSVLFICAPVIIINADYLTFNLIAPWTMITNWKKCKRNKFYITLNDQVGRENAQGMRNASLIEFQEYEIVVLENRD